MTTLTDAAPYRRKIQMLIRQGATTVSIAAATGLTPTSVDYIRKGQPTVRRYAAEHLELVTLADCLEHTAGHGWMSATGTARRIRALLAIGWTHEHLHAATGIATRRHVKGDKGRVTRRTHEAIAGLYDRLSMTPGPSEQNRARARRLGWVPPLAWDDELIDDPTARPRGVAA